MSSPNQMNEMEDTNDVTSPDDLHQRSIRDAHRSIKKLQQSSLEFANSIRETYLLFDRFITMVGEEEFNIHQVTRHLSPNSSSTLKLRNALSLKGLAQQWLVLGDILENISNESAATALDQVDMYAVPSKVRRSPIPVRVVRRHGSRKMTVDELIRALEKVSTKDSSNPEREDLLRKTVVQAHYELGNAMMFHKELQECEIHTPGYVSLLSMAADRVKRTRCIISMSIRELINIDEIYEDFFIEYIAAINSLGGKEDATVKKSVNRNDAYLRDDAPTPMVDSDIDVYKNSHERLIGCVMVMGSLIEEFNAVFGVRTLPAGSTSAPRTSV